MPDLAPKLAVPPVSKITHMESTTREIIAQINATAATIHRIRTEGVRPVPSAKPPLPGFSAREFEAYLPQNVKDVLDSLINSIGTPETEELPNTPAPAPAAQA